MRASERAQSQRVWRFTRQLTELSRVEDGLEQPLIAAVDLAALLRAIGRDHRTSRSRSRARSPIDRLAPSRRGALPGPRECSAARRPAGDGLPGRGGDHRDRPRPGVPGGPPAARHRALRDRHASRRAWRRARPRARGRARATHRRDARAGQHTLPRSRRHDPPTRPLKTRYRHARARTRSATSPISSGDRSSRLAAVPACCCLLPTRKGAIRPRLVPRRADRAARMSSSMQVLLTGMSGTGKSSVVRELRRRGFIAYDADDDGYAEPDADGVWRWRTSKISELLARSDDERLFFAGCDEGQTRFRWDLKILLMARTGHRRAAGKQEHQLLRQERRGARTGPGGLAGRRAPAPKIS